MNNKKQKHIINNLLNSPDLLGQCIDILKPSYFEPEFIPHVKFLINYHSKYNSNPTVELMNSEVDTDDEYEKYIIPTEEIDYSAEELESFCRRSAMIEAVTDSFNHIQEDEMGEVYKKVSDALNISLRKDLGVDVMDNPAERLTSLLEELDYVSTGIKILDEYMGGGSVRKQLGIISANSGGGKSVFLSNLANNYVLQGLDVVYVSLELPADMIFLRQAYIMSSFSHRVWKQNIPQIAAKMNEFKKFGTGNFRIIRLPLASNANAIRSYLKQYEIEYGKGPDVLIVDYLDLMTPISGIKNKGISEQDKEKSEDLYEILHSYDMIGWSASQQNRDALKMDTPNQSVVAGGLSKINICDYWISAYMDGNMRLAGDLMIYMLKTRYSSGMHKSAVLSFCEDSLKIADHENPDKAEDLIRQIAKKKTDRKSSKEKNVIEAALDAGDLELPGAESTEKAREINTKLDRLKEQLVDFSDEDENPPIHENQDFMELLDFAVETRS